MYMPSKIYERHLAKPFSFYFFSLDRFELRGLLVLWNSALAIFSIVGASRTAPELIHVLRHYGLFHSVCDPRSVYYT